MSLPFLPQSHAYVQTAMFLHSNNCAFNNQIKSPCLDTNPNFQTFSTTGSVYSDLMSQFIPNPQIQISPITIFRSFPYWMNQFFLVLPLFSLQYLSISQRVYFSTLSIKHHINNCVNCVNLIPLSLFFPLSLSLSIYLCEISLSLSFHILHLRYNSLTMHCLLHTLILLKNSVSSNQQTSN